MKRKSVRIKQDLKTEAANQEAEQRWKKEKASRQANAEKQRRYRQSMKAQGYKAKLIWEKPLEAGWVKVEAPIIRENSLEITGNNPEIGEVLHGLFGKFIFECKKQGISEERWRPVYRDFQTLLKPLGLENNWVTK
jgi:hypothetical protein